MQNFVKEDRTQMCNLDRFIEATMPANFSSSQNSLAELIEAYHKVSIKGIQIEFLDDRSEKLQHVFTFMPTLSSLYLMTKGNEATTSTDRRALEKLKSKVIEFHEDQPHYKRKPLSH